MKRNIVLIGGPADFDEDALGIRRIGCDYVSLVSDLYAARPEEADYVVFWPNPRVFCLPRSFEAWETARHGQHGWVSIARAYWALRYGLNEPKSGAGWNNPPLPSGEEDEGPNLSNPYPSGYRHEDFMMRSAMGQERGRVLAKPQDKADCRRVEHYVEVESWLLLRPIVQAIPRGLVVLSVLPADMDKQGLMRANGWLTEYLCLQRLGVDQRIDVSSPSSALDELAVQWNAMTRTPRWLVDHAEEIQDSLPRPVLGPMTWDRILFSPERHEPPGMKDEHLGTWWGDGTSLTVRQGPATRTRWSASLILESDRGAAIIGSAPANPREFFAALQNPPLPKSPSTPEQVVAATEHDRERTAEEGSPAPVAKATSREASPIQAGMTPGDAMPTTSTTAEPPAAIPPAPKPQEKWIACRGLYYTPGFMRVRIGDREWNLAKHELTKAFLRFMIEEKVFSERKALLVRTEIDPPVREIADRLRKGERSRVRIEDYFADRPGKHDLQDLRKILIPPPRNNRYYLALPNPSRGR